VKKKKRPRHLLWTLVVCAGLYFLDALLIGLPSLGTFLSVVFMLTNLVAFLWQRRGERAMVMKYGIRSLAFCLTVFAILSTFMFNRHMGQVNARRIIEAVEDYRSEQGKYPERLEDLVPQYFSKVPRAAIRFTSAEYYYLRHKDHHGLMWTVVPPFGRRTYRFETKEWSIID
jgi:ABC-type multidrug transport system fused ATPase/permease subunit